MGTREEMHELVGETTLEAMPTRLCEVGREQLGVDGVGIALIASTQARALLATSGSFVARLEAAQFDLGEGPCLEAHGRGVPSLEPDLVSARARGRWPLFADAAIGLGVKAVFAFPLHTGATRFGVLDAARGRAGPLNGEQIEDALCLAELASEVVLLLQAAALGDGSVGAMSSHRIVVHQAAGMVSAQAGMNVTDAFAWLQSRAYTLERRLEDVASDVVARHIAFEAP